MLEELKISGIVVRGLALICSQSHAAFFIERDIARYALTTICCALHTDASKVQKESHYESKASGNKNMAFAHRVQLIKTCWLQVRTFVCAVLFAPALVGRSAILFYWNRAPRLWSWKGADDQYCVRNSPPLEFYGEEPPMAESL